MTRIHFVVVVLLLGVSLSSYARTRNGVEIGNAHGNPDTVGGFEIGNGLPLNEAAFYRLGKVFGNWKGFSFNAFIELTAITVDAIKTRASFDLISSLDVMSKSDLVNKMRGKGWIEAKNMPLVVAVVRDSASLSGIRKLEYRIFKGPGELIEVVLTGPQGDPGFSVFEQFQKSMETFEVTG